MSGNRPQCSFGEPEAAGVDIAQADELVDIVVVLAQLFASQADPADAGADEGYTSLRRFRPTSQNGDAARDKKVSS